MHPVGVATNLLEAFNAGDLTGCVNSSRRT
jgi:hypothetical protein